MKRRHDEADERKKRIKIDFENAGPPRKKDYWLEESDEEEDEEDDEEEWDEESDEDSDDDRKYGEVKELTNAKYFEPKDPESGQLIVFVGKSERGKTHFLKWLILEQMQRKEKPLTAGLVFVKTKFKHSYDFVPENRIIKGYNEDVLRQFVQNLEAMYSDQGYLDPTFIVFDDLVGILGSQTPWFNNFMGTYRHYNIHVFIAVQYLTGRNAISPIMREQTTFAILFNSKTFNTLKNLYENYGQLFPRMRDFQQYFYDNTEPSKVGKYVAIVYKEAEDEIEQNYIPMRAPAKLSEAGIEEEPEAPFPDPALGGPTLREAHKAQTGFKGDPESSLGRLTSQGGGRRV